MPGMALTTRSLAFTGSPGLPAASGRLSCAASCSTRRRTLDGWCRIPLGPFHDVGGPVDDCAVVEEQGRHLVVSGEALDRAPPLPERVGPVAAACPNDAGVVSG